MVQDFKEAIVPTDNVDHGTSVDYTGQILIPEKQLNETSLHRERKYSKHISVQLK